MVARDAQPRRYSAAFSTSCGTASNTVCYLFWRIVIEHFLGFRDVESPNGRITTDRQMFFDLASGSFGQMSGIKQ